VSSLKPALRKRLVIEHPLFAAESLETRRLFTVGSAFSAPANPEISTDISPSWKFALNPAGGTNGGTAPAATGFDDASWTTVNLPYTWNSSSTNVVLGDGWYRKTVTIPAAMVGDEIYLQFQGASLSASVYVDGTLVGSHNGGWETFDIDVTPEMTVGSHLIAVDVNNQTNANIVPAGGGDYTKEGGLYRQVSLLAVSPAHIALTEPVLSTDPSGSVLGGSGVYFSNSTVVMGAASATIQVGTVLDNSSSSASPPLTVTSYLVDANGIIQAQSTSTSPALNANQTDVTVTQTATVANPHLWDGLADPYLYDLYVEVSDTTTGQLLDVNHQQVGIRSFSLNSQTGFFLNGQSYNLHGVNLHQDSGAPGSNGGLAGWAQTDAQQENDINRALAVGATMIRTAHYQRDPDFYDYCDQKGLIIESEIGVNTTVTGGVGSAFATNAEDQLNEMVRENYNHPSIVFWSMFNEIDENATNGALTAALSTMAHALDAQHDVPGTQGRYTIVETDHGTVPAAAGTIDGSTDVVNEHNYSGWYGGNPSGIGLPTASAGSTPVGIGEFGAGGSAYQFTLPANIHIPASSAPDGTGSVYHPENQQTEISEEQYAYILQNAPQSVDTLVWSMFDFSSTDRNEGVTSGINDKGLVTRDRQTPKDIYYFYQANWNDPTSARGYDTTPVIWISDHTWTDREGTGTTLSVPLTVFSNVGAPTLTLNGAPPLTLTPQVLNNVTIPDAYSANITLEPGNNTILVSGTVNGQTYTNSVVWNYHQTVLSGAPYANIEFTTASNNVQAGYAPDTGQAFGTQSNGATYGWTMPVAEVDTLTPGGTITAGDIDSINLPNGAGQVQYTVLAGETTPAAVAEGLANAWDASLSAAAIGSAATTQTGALTITAATPDLPLGLTSSVAGVGTLTTTITTAASNNPAANASGTYDQTGNTNAPYDSLSAQTGIILNPGNVWQYQLPNGTYDVHIVGADSSTSTLVDNLSLNGTTLHATSFSTTGGTFQQFYATVNVTNGLLSVTGGPGMVLSVGGVPTTQGRLSSIQINQLGTTATTTVVTSSSPSPAEGQPVTFTATVTPSSGSGETGAVQFVIDGSDAGGPVTVADGTAAYTTSSLSEGDHSIVAIYSGDATFAGSASSTFTQGVNAGPSKLVFIQQPTAIQPGVVLSPAVVVAIEDQNGVVQTTDNSSVTLDISSGPGSLNGTTTVSSQAVDGIATFRNLVLGADSGTVTLGASDGSDVGANSADITITPQAAANHLTFIQQPSDVAPNSVMTPPVTVEVATPGGALVNSDAPITLSANTGPGILGGTDTVDAVNGIATFNDLVLPTTGYYTLSASSNAVTAAASSLFRVARRMAFVQVPPQTTAGPRIAPSVIVEVLDQNDNPVTTDDSDISLSIASGPFATLLGTTTLPLVNGIADFQNLSIKRAGTYTLSASDDGSTITSGTLTVLPSAARKLVFLSQPQATGVGSTLDPIVVAIEDEFGNIVTSARAPVRLTLVSASGRAKLHYDRVKPIKGLAAFDQLTPIAAGTYMLKATDGKLPFTLSDSFIIGPEDAAIVHLLNRQ